MSLPRFLVVLFPIFMWMAVVCEERRATARVAAVSAVVLGLFTTPVRHLAVRRVTPVRAVLLDALGTLVELRASGAAAARRRCSSWAAWTSGDAAAERGFAAEIAHYLAHHLRGRRPGGAGAPARRLRRGDARRDRPSDELDRATVRRAMLAALEFAPFPDAEPALAELRGRGLRLVVASNWDCSLPRVARAGGPVGRCSTAPRRRRWSASPSPRPPCSARRSRSPGWRPHEALHVGDSLGQRRGGGARRGSSRGADRPRRARHTTASRSWPRSATLPSLL